MAESQVGSVHTHNGANCAKYLLHKDQNLGSATPPAQIIPLLGDLSDHEDHSEIFMALTEMPFLIRSQCNVQIF